jgi:hypothetical protein
MNKASPYSSLAPTPYGNNEDIWLPVEDDIMICMQNATSDPNFVYTIHWLNNAKGITRTIPRTAEEARVRYQFLCSSGKRDLRLKDQNVTRTITKLMKSMKRPMADGGQQSMDGTTPGDGSAALSTSGTGENVMAPSSVATPHSMSAATSAVGVSGTDANQSTGNASNSETSGAYGGTTQG